KKTRTRVKQGILFFPMLLSRIYPPFLSRGSFIHLRSQRYLSTQNQKPSTITTPKMSLNGADVTQNKDESPTFPYIQESVRNDPFKVPQRYTRSEEVIQKSLFMPQLSSQLPVIDFALLLDRNKDELSKLDIACKEWGFFQVRQVDINALISLQCSYFFQIVNHGVEIDLMQRMKDAAAEFFESPIEKKIKYAMPSGGLEGYGHAPVDWSDRVNLTIYPTRFRQLQFWPEELK
ncbi:hypothetical protein KIW84_034421, partial [Lathyrus oleraceus]